MSTYPSSPLRADTDYDNNGYNTVHDFADSSVKKRKKIKIVKLFAGNFAKQRVIYVKESAAGAD